MNNITQNDLVFLLKQDQSQLDIIVAGMTAVIDDTERKCEALKHQQWVKLMFATVLESKKPKPEMITQKSVELRLYCAEALAELFYHQKISDAIAVNLGTQINEIFATRPELRHVISSFAGQMGEKIENMDRYYTLVKEIELGMFGADGNLFWLYRTMAEIDDVTLQDTRKVELFSNLMYEKNIVQKAPVPVGDFIMGMLSIPEEHIGAVYMEMQNYSGSTTVDLATAAIERWHMQSESNKQYLKKERLVAKLFKEFEIDKDVKISPRIELAAMIETKMIRINTALEREIERMEREAERKERQQEIQANVVKNVHELQTNVKKNMRSFKGFLGTAKTKVVDFSRQLKKPPALPPPDNDQAI